MKTKLPIKLPIELAHKLNLLRPGKTFQRIYSIATKETDGIPEMSKSVNDLEERAVLVEGFVVVEMIFSILEGARDVTELLVSNGCADWHWEVFRHDTGEFIHMDEVDWDLLVERKVPVCLIPNKLLE